jgi:hypothetical protein
MHTRTAFAGHKSVLQPKTSDIISYRYVAQTMGNDGRVVIILYKWRMISARRSSQMYAENDVHTFM